MTEEGKQEITRRQVLRSAVIWTAIGAGTVLFGSVLWRLMPRLDQTHTVSAVLAARNAARPSGNVRWFTPEEVDLVGVLADLIVPSDGMGPGAKDAGVLDELDQMVARSPFRQRLYGEGLIALDDLAHVHGENRFQNLSQAKQIEILKILERAGTVVDYEPASLRDKIQHKLAYWYYVGWLGASRPAVYLFQRVVWDVKAKFYASPAAWEWLGYNGPPFPFGNIGRIAKCAKGEMAGNG